MSYYKQMTSLDNSSSLAFYGTQAATAGTSSTRILTETETIALLQQEKNILICGRFGLPELKHKARLLDVMELWAFVYPARSCVPSPLGLARFFNESPPQEAQAAAAFILRAARRLLDALSEMTTMATMTTGEAHRAAAIAEMMKEGGWAWGEVVGQHLPPVKKESSREFTKLVGDLPRWRIPKIEKSTSPKTRAPKPRQQDAQVFLTQAEALLQAALGETAEARAGQIDYMHQAAELTLGNQALPPQVMLAQADTGVGKTLGYLVPAYLAAKQTSEPVWVITHTRALQTQIARESQKLPEHKIAIRKGRENYLCLLNFEEGLANQRGTNRILLGFIARWIRASKDGDIRSGDFPSWLAQGGEQNRFTDSRENCIHSACPHYRSCFVERQRIDAMDADIVIANHALVLSNHLLAPQENEGRHYVFDEGHHLFSVADSAFSYRLTGREMGRLRFWLVGRGGGDLLRSARFAEQGLAARITPILEQHPHIVPLLNEVSAAARFLPQARWQERVESAQPLTSAENFLLEIKNKVWDAQTKQDEGYDLESLPSELQSAQELEQNLTELQTAMEHLFLALSVIEDKALLSVVRVLQNGSQEQLPVWIKMCQRARQTEGLVQWVDRFVIERDESHPKSIGQDIGMTRCALDPSKDFAEKVLAQTKTALITSASLTPLRPTDSDKQEDNYDWVTWRTGAKHLPQQAKFIYAPSPFDYATQAKMLVITDIEKNNRAKAEAMAALFCASKGGGLGLWTSIRRLKQAHGLIARKLKEQGLQLLAQHHGLGLATLIDIFREDENACLLGTDALRDGMDVPGRALRLIAFDKMPWAKPDILHKERRKLFKQGFYDDMIVASRLQQAFGRLIRKHNDRGVFVLLDNRFPSRLKPIFPAHLSIERVPLKEALVQIESFFK